MKLNALISLSALLASTGAAAVPDTFMYVGALDQDGVPATGTFSVTFQMFNDASAGDVVFAETVVSLDVVDGALIHELGASPSNPLEDAELDGELFISVIVNGTALEPRVPLRSVPFSAVSENAQALGGLPSADYLRRSELVAGDGIDVDGGTISVANDGITLEMLTPAIARERVSGQNSGERLIVLRRPAPCGGGLDVFEDTLPVGSLASSRYECPVITPCGVNSLGAPLFRTGCTSSPCVEGDNFVGTEPIGRCTVTIRTNGQNGENRNINSNAGVVGQLIALENNN